MCIPGSRAFKLKKFPQRLTPGKDGEVKAELLTNELPEGPFALEVTVVTNDPLHPSRVVRLVGVKNDRPGRSPELAKRSGKEKFENQVEKI